MIKPKVRHKIYERDGGVCSYCGKALDSSFPNDHPNAPTLDHVTPRSKGGSNCHDNLVACCLACNRQKRDQEEDVFLVEIGVDNAWYWREDFGAEDYEH